MSFTNISCTRDSACMNETDVALSRYLRDLAHIPLITPEEEIDLVGRIQNGDEVAREQMICSNLRLFVTIAHDYVDLGLPLMDLIAKGNIGLMNAVDRLDPSRGAKLSTYAAWWIRQTIKRAVADQSKTVRVPSQMIDKVTRLRRVSSQLSNELGREVTEEEISEELGIAADKIARLKTIGLAAGVVTCAARCRRRGRSLGNDCRPTSADTARASGRERSSRQDRYCPSITEQT